VRLALQAGFRGFDTANQRKHYFEAAVGEALAGTPRDELFLQTKFTSRGGQDSRLPYDPRADLATQVRQSFSSSLEHLRTTHLDSYVLHGPSHSEGLSDGDWTVWREMEALNREGQARLLGVSNVSLRQLRLLHEGSASKPAFVQNRCYASDRWDRDVREYCDRHGIVYQGFSLLTANARALSSAPVRKAAARTGRTPAQVVFRFALQVGMLPLTGTSNSAHMQEDLACLDFTLEPAEVQAIESCGLD
jgi:diketogulonate reductase-like aldo/keto reductase